MVLLKELSCFVNRRSWVRNGHSDWWHSKSIDCNCRLLICVGSCGVFFLGGKVFGDCFICICLVNRRVRNPKILVQVLLACSCGKLFGDCFICICLVDLRVVISKYWFVCYWHVLEGYWTTCSLLCVVYISIHLFRWFEGFIEFATGCGISAMIEAQFSSLCGSYSKMAWCSQVILWVWPGVCSIVQVWAYLACSLFFWSVGISGP